MTHTRLTLSHTEDQTQRLASGMLDKQKELLIESNRVP